MISTTNKKYDGGPDPVVMEKDYFNVLEEITELHYFQNGQKVLFGCL